MLLPISYYRNDNFGYLIVWTVVSIMQGDIYKKILFYYSCCKQYINEVIRETIDDRVKSITRTRKSCQN